MESSTNLFAPKALENSSARNETVLLIGASRFEVEICVDDHHQAALEAICGPRVPKGFSCIETACLIREDRNPYTKDAVRVEIDHEPVGYLYPEDAVTCREQIQARGGDRASGQCQAVIRRGEGPYQVWLDLPTWWQ